MKEAIRQMRRGLSFVKKMKNEEPPRFINFKIEEDDNSLSEDWEMIWECFPGRIIRRIGKVEGYM